MLCILAIQTSRVTHTGPVFGNVWCSPGAMALGESTSRRSAAMFSSKSGGMGMDGWEGGSEGETEELER